RRRDQLGRVSSLSGVGSRRSEIPERHFKLILTLKACPWCAALFETTNAQRRYCSKQCLRRDFQNRTRDKRNADSRRRYHDNTPHYKAKHDRWFLANREHARAYRRKSLLREQYGLTPEH